MEKEKAINILKDYSIFYEDFIFYKDFYRFTNLIMGKINIYITKTFDLFHLGHMQTLKQCKDMFYNVNLIVGI